VSKSNSVAEERSIIITTHFRLNLLGLLDWTDTTKGTCDVSMLGATVQKEYIGDIGSNFQGRNNWTSHFPPEEVRVEVRKFIAVQSSERTP
jgi:hypothetical protein